MKYTVFYISGLTELHKPGQTRIVVDRKGIKLHRQFIDWESVRDAQVKYEVVNKGGSIGGALIGEALAGTAGAVVGGMGGKKGVDTYLHVAYAIEGEEHELLMMTVGYEKLQQKLAKLIVQKGKIESPKEIYARQRSKRSENNQKQWGLIGQLWSIYKWPWVVMLRFLRLMFNRSS